MPGSTAWSWQLTPEERCKRSPRLAVWETKVWVTAEHILSGRVSHNPIRSISRDLARPVTLTKDCFVCIFLPLVWFCLTEKIFSTPWALSRFIRRGRAARADDADMDLEIASDVSDSELSSWLTKPGASSAMQFLHGSDKGKMTKFLPPGNCQELYQHYLATRDLIGSKAVS